MKTVYSFLIGLISGLASSAVVFCIQNEGDTAVNLLLVGSYLIFLLFVGVLVYRLFKHESSMIVLKDMAVNRRESDASIWAYGKYGDSVVQMNSTWKEWIDDLLKTTERPDLAYYNFGKEYYFFDFMSGKKIKIPTESDAKRLLVKESIQPGMVLRLMRRE